MAHDHLDLPRPLTRDELLEWLGNIVKMHQFAATSDYGSVSHRLYHDGMPRCAQFIIDCVKLTPEIK